jgi:hypothetical protein
MCIDQNNNLEHNYQVRQIGNIYSQADRVVTWLGRDPELENVLQRADTYNSSAPQHIGHKARKSFRYHTYWSHAWIIQEVVLAKRVDVVAGT